MGRHRDPLFCSVGYMCVGVWCGRASELIRERETTECRVPCSSSCDGCGPAWMQTDLFVLSTGSRGPCGRDVLERWLLGFGEGWKVVVVGWNGRSVGQSVSRSVSRRSVSRVWSSEVMDMHRVPGWAGLGPGCALSVSLSVSAARHIGREASCTRMLACWLLACLACSQLARD